MTFFRLLQSALNPVLGIEGIEIRFESLVTKIRCG